MYCNTGKNSYKTRKEAIDFNIAIGRKTGEYHYIYRCIICGDYHLATRECNKKVNRIKYR
jgi:hypothetical protein